MQQPPKEAKVGSNAVRFSLVAFSLVALVLFVVFLFFSEPGAARLGASERLNPAPQIAFLSFSSHGAASVKAAPGPIAPTKREPAAMGPKEEFLARCHVIERLDYPATDGRWQRELLVRDPWDGQFFRVEESWSLGTDGGGTYLENRGVFSATRLMIQVAPGAVRGNLEVILSPLGLTLLDEITPGVFAAELPRASLQGVPRVLSALRPHVLQVEPDGVGFAAASPPNDPHFLNQWNLLNTGQSMGAPGVDVAATALWAALPSKADVTVAVLDTGVDYTHPDLRHLVRRGQDFVNKDSDPSDDHGHGTGVAGVIFAARNNGIGTAGLLPEAGLLNVKVLGRDKKGSTSDLIAGLSYARTHGASVINLSLVGYTPPGANPTQDSLLAQELARCEAADIVLCISAGNNGTDNDRFPDYPSAHPNANIIAVGNHDRFGRRWSGLGNPSNFGATRVDIFAPGAAILSPDLPRSYGNVSLWTGTSVATPHVAATAAALKILRPLWSAADIKAAILESAVRSPALTGLCQTGGRLDAARAADYALQRPQRSQKIPAFAPIKDTPFRTTLILTNTTSSAGLPVSFSVVSGPARVSGNRLSVIGVGKVVLAARQPGNTEFNAAPALNTSFNAVKARQTIQFTLPSSRPFVRNGKLALNAASTAKLPVNYVSSNPRIIAITGKAPKAVAVIKGKGPVRITATQRGNNNYLPAKSVSRTITIK